MGKSTLEKGMLLHILLLPLAAALQSSPGQGKSPKVLNLSKKQQKEIVDSFNSIRKIVSPTAKNMLKMRWSEKTTNSAKEWARICSGKPSALESRTVDGLKCGEIISQSNFIRSWLDVIQSWNNSKARFHYGDTSVDPNKMSSPYTQIIWHNTDMVGCVFSYCPNNELLFSHICRFCPLGNILHMIPNPYEEGPPCGDCPEQCEDKLCTKLCKDTSNDGSCEHLARYFTCEAKWVWKRCPDFCKCKTKVI